MAKTKSGRHQLNLAEELKDILNEYSKELYANKEQALDKASDYLMGKLEQASPVDTGEFKQSWVRTTKYKGVRYIGNSAVGGKNKYGYSILKHPFMGSCYGWWAAKKKILKEKYNIDWLSPAECNPDIHYD